MHRFTSSIRRPVKRQGAEQYLFITLISFAASVTLTRMFLELTGYPQLGGGVLHIAHVLWGGLLLFLASLLPLIFANRWVYIVGSILAGAGVGLFIDEVGKFITQTNDYFYPLAAPIIYAFFLLTVMIYLRVRRPPNRDARAELYRAFDAMEEVLEHDLDPREREELRQRLEHIIQTSEREDLRRLGKDLLDFLECEQLELAQERFTWFHKAQDRWRAFEAHWVSRGRFKAALAGGLLALALVALANMAVRLPLGPTINSLENIIQQMFEEGQVSTTRGLTFFLARIGLEASVGLLLLIAASLLIAGFESLAVGIGYIGLLLSITTVNLLVFYFDQFSTIVTALVQFTILLALVYYRDRFLEQPAPPSKEEQTGEEAELEEGR